MTNNNNKKNIFITDLIESKVQKQREIEKYESQLKIIEEKLFFLRKEKEITETILELIEHEKIIDLRNYMIENDTWKYWCTPDATHLVSFVSKPSLC